MTRRRWITLALLVAAVAAIYVWRVTHRPPPVDPYKTTVAARGDLTETITANGTINPVRVVNVGTQVSGTVSALYADFNDRVKQGQVLLRLEPSVFQAKLAASEAALANIRSTAALQAANARRSEQLFKQDYISRQEYETAQATANSSRAQVQQAEAQIKQDRTNLGYTVITSPVSGVVISRQIDIGQTVAASFNTPTLFQIARDLTRMQIEASIAEADIAKVHQGQVVRFTVDAYGARQFEGTVSQIRLNPTTQQNVVTYTVIVAVANPDGALLPGMTANASFLVSERKNVLLVPNQALSFKPEAYVPPKRRANAAADTDLVTIFVLAGGQPQPRRVRVGASDTDQSEIVAGDLGAGEAVITAENKADKPKSGFGPPESASDKRARTGTNGGGAPAK